MVVVEVRGLTERFGAVLAGGRGSLWACGNDWARPPPCSSPRSSSSTRRPTASILMASGGSAPCCAMSGAQGRTVLVIQSRVGRVRASVDRVVVFDHGRLVTQSSRAALLASASQVVRIRSPPHRRAARRPHRDGARSRVVAVDRLEVTGCPPERVAVLGAERSISIVEVLPRRPCSKTYSSGSPDVRPDAVLTIMLQLAERR